MTEKLTYQKEDILGYECKHATYTEAQGRSDDDLLVIKENIHLKDGRVIPNVRLKKNYERRFGVTKEGQRNHKDKKEWELLSKLQTFPTTQRRMMQNVARALGRGSIQGGPRAAARSPYLYGTDITTPTLVKQYYQKMCPDAISDNTVAVFDIETDMVEHHERPIMMSLTFKDRAVLVIVESFMTGVPNAEQQIQDAFVKYLGDVKTQRNIQLEVVFAKTPGQAVIETFKRAHEWKPDIVAVWNINFDMPKILKELERESIDPADVFSDPAVPHNFRSFKYREGAAQKITSSGKSMALHPAEQWHVIETPASFYFLDAMCVYLKIRIAKGKEPSYSLNAVLTKHLGIRKLEFEEANGYSLGRWHTFMQMYHKVAYCIYNLFDCISMELLDDKTTDLKRTISLLCGPSEYSKFPSQPRRTCDDLHFFCESKDRMIASTSDKMEDENDPLVVELTDWIN